MTRGVGDLIPDGTDTLRYIKYADMPKKGFAAYRKIVCEYKPYKFGTNRSQLVVGGDEIDYPFGLSTLTSDITLFKCLISSVLSIPKAKFMTIHIKDFYLNTPM